MGRLRKALDFSKDSQHNDMFKATTSAALLTMPLPQVPPLPYCCYATIIASLVLWCRSSCHLAICTKRALGKTFALSCLRCEAFCKAKAIPSCNMKPLSGTHFITCQALRNPLCSSRRLFNHIAFTSRAISECFFKSSDLRQQDIL